MFHHKGRLWERDLHEPHSNLEKDLSGSRQGLEARHVFTRKRGVLVLELYPGVGKLGWRRNLSVVLEFGIE